MAINVNDVLRVVYFQRLYGQRLLTVLHLRCTTAPGVLIPEYDELVSVATVLGGVTNFPLLGWLPLVSGDLTFDEVRVQKVYPARSIYAKEFIGVTGSASGEARQPNTALSIEKRSVTPDRTGIGRIQMGGSRSVEVTEGSFEGTYLADVQAQWEGLLDPLNVAAHSSEYNWCLFNGNAVTKDDDIIDIQAKDTVRTMHRRTVRVGE